MAKILLVEDDNNLREIYEARLQAEGYDVVAASDGEEALVVAKNESPDLVISDVMMPKISGFEMLDIMRNTAALKDVKVIMLTALGQAEDQSRADKLGADRYLVKSQVTLEDIVNVAQSLLIKAGAIDDPAAAATPTSTDEPVAVVTPPTSEPVAVTAPPADLIAAEPVAAEPVANLAVASEPVAAPEPPSSPALAMDDQPAASEPTATPTEADQAQTSAQEEEVVEEQIDNFVDTQSGVAPAEVPAAAEPSVVQPEVTTPETLPEPAGSTTTPEQQQALDNAVTVLNNPTGSVPAVEPPTVDTDTTPVMPTTDSGAIRKKVIKPLDNPDQPKKSLDELLAEETAKQSGSTEPAAVTTPTPPTEPVMPTAEDQPPSSQPTTIDDFDPNSIAL